MLPSFAFSLISADISAKAPYFDMFLRILPRFLPYSQRFVFTYALSS